MPRPKALEQIELVPKIVIDPKSYLAGYKGIVDDKGRIHTLGLEYAGMEIYVFVRKSDCQLSDRMSMWILRSELIS